VSTRGPGQTRLSSEAYALALRMLADNYRKPQIMRAIHERFPEHRPDGERPVTKQVIWSLARTRRDEVRGLREKLNQELDDLWIANKRQRLVALQEMFEDCNRWTPKKVIEVPAPPKDGEEVRARVLIVYEKDVPAMLGVLKQAREELGVTAEDRAAKSLQDLVQMAEEQRGLKRTTTIDAHPVDAVEYIEDAQVLELPPAARTKGADAVRGFLAGDADVGSEAMLQLDVGDAFVEHPQGTPTLEK